MKKGCFINCICMDEENIKSSGVMKKVYSQIEVLRKYFEVDHLLINTYPGRQNPLDKIKRRLPFFPVDYNWKYSDEFSGYDFIYFRKSDIDYTVYKFFKDIKKHNPDCKIIFEIPTYPYEKENFHGKKDFPLLLKDRVNTRKLHKCVDRIVTYSDDNEIFGIKTIKTINGFDFSKVALPKAKDIGKDIHLIEVSSPAYWHGYDRVLTGMGEYYANGGNRKLIFHIVGNGSEIAKYKEIVAKYKLEQNVIFHGNCYGDVLSNIYAQANIAIDSLARHRSNNTTNSSLKSREYAAYGLPFISSVPIDYATKDWEYIMYVPADESPLNINSLISFFDKIYSEKTWQQVAYDIRSFAEQRCDMSVTLKPVVDYVNN